MHTHRIERVTSPRNHHLQWEEMSFCPKTINLGFKTQARLLSPTGSYNLKNWHGKKVWNWREPRFNYSVQKTMDNSSNSWVADFLFTFPLIFSPNMSEWVRLGFTKNLPTCMRLLCLSKWFVVVAAKFLLCSLIIVYAKALLLLYRNHDKNSAK